MSFRLRQQATPTSQDHVPPTPTSPTVSTVFTSQQAQRKAVGRSRPQHIDTTAPGSCAPTPEKAPIVVLDLDFPPLPPSSPAQRQRVSGWTHTPPIHVRRATIPVAPLDAPLLLPPAPLAPVPGGFMEHAPPSWQFTRAECNLDSTGPLLVGPNVSISANVRVGPGVRLTGCILLDGVEVKENAVIMHSIVGWKSSIGRWARVQGIGNYAAKLGITILGEDVSVEDEVVVTSCIVLPHKTLNMNVQEEIIL
ncbi:hypothetical protein L7F22_060706 [Adiantum nelumboides]|nr:hypothetical protein [Adiantum nelumboides]